MLTAADTAMNTPILTHWAEMYADLEYDLQTVQGYLAAALKLAIESKRALEVQRTWNQILRDENQYLRDTLNAERDIRAEPDDARRAA